VAVAACAVLAGAAATPAAASARPAHSFLLVFPPPSGDDAALAQLRAVPGLSLGLLSATEGVYRSEQLLLDVGAGDRVEYGSYHPSRPPPLRLVRSGAGGVLAGWPAVIDRAAAAPQLISPGALAGGIPGGGAYAGVTGTPTTDAIAAADPRGAVAAWSDGPAQTLPARVRALLAAHPFVVADLPDESDLRALVAARAPGELVVAVQRAPDRADALLAVGAAGLGTGAELTSDTTRQRGLVASIDLPVTALRRLGLAVPAAMRGAPLRVEGTRSAASLRQLRERLLVVASRRMPVLLWLALATALLAALGRRRGTRISGLAWLWLPAAALLPAPLSLSRPEEVAVVVAAALALGAVTEAAAPWPRAPAVPAAGVLLALTIDALAGTHLLIRSVLGPNPAFGARFYGIGNELKSGLAVLVFAGVAAALSGRGWPARRRAAAMAGAGTLLAVVEGSARIGAGVGGVLLVAAGTAVAVVLLLPGGWNRRRAAVVVLAPLAGLAGLAALDLLFAHGTGHFTGSVLHARSAGDLRDLLVRRSRDAWDASKDGRMPEAFAAAAVAIAVGVRYRAWLLAPVRAAGEDTAALWTAALAGGLTAGVTGMAVEDSGALLLVVAVIALAAVLAYLRAAPAAAHDEIPSQIRRDLVIIRPVEERDVVS
jgi:hypothetical protein